MTEPPKSSTDSSAESDVETDVPEDSHSLTPEADLLGWLEARKTTDGKRARFVFPIVVVVGGLGIDSAFIGSSVDGLEDEHLSVRLDDSALGIPLTDRIRTLCPDADRCALWIEGHWGPLLVGGPPVDNESPTVAVLTVGDVLPANSTSIRVRIAN